MENMNNEVVESVDEVLDNCVVVENPGQKNFGKTVGKVCLFTGIAAGIAALGYKFRDKIREKVISKLVKDGYTVVHPSDLSDNSVFETPIDESEN